MTNRDDARDTGIPTRAIHEAYLSMQQSHRRYRMHRDNPQKNEKRAQADFQEDVLTFYELIRPHLKRKSGMGKFWEGDLPDYPNQSWASTEQAKQYCTEYGTAIWGLQKHVQTIAESPNVGASGGDASAMADGGTSLKEWHDHLGLTDSQRIVALEQEDGGVMWVELRAVSGLKQLDSWSTREVKKREQQEGFMAGETSTTVDLEYVPVWKLTKAKRLLAEAADKMNLLSQVEVDHNDGAIVNFDQSREGVEPEYRTADYDTSPDI